MISPNPLPTYPDGFPQEVLAPFSEQTGRGVLCNKPYSGTDVIRDYGEEHLRTGNLIVYTSADSVFRPMRNWFRWRSCTGTAGLPERFCRENTEWAG